jgi:hypothetical protein
MISIWFFFFFWFYFFAEFLIHILHCLPNFIELFVYILLDLFELLKKSFLKSSVGISFIWISLESVTSIMIFWRCHSTFFFSWFLHLYLCIWRVMYLCHFYGVVFMVSDFLLKMHLEASVCYIILCLFPCKYLV